MLRRLPAAYADGVYEPSGRDRPNPMAISQAVMSGPTGKRSERDRTAFLVFFGKLVLVIMIMKDIQTAIIMKECVFPGFISQCLNLHYQYVSIY